MRSAGRATTPEARWVVTQPANVQKPQICRVEGPTCRAVRHCEPRRSLLRVELPIGTFGDADLPQSLTGRTDFDRAGPGIEL